MLCARHSPVNQNLLTATICFMEEQILKKPVPESLYLRDPRLCPLVSRTDRVRTSKGGEHRVAYIVRGWVLYDNASKFDTHLPVNIQKIGFQISIHKQYFVAHTIFWKDGLQKTQSISRRTSSNYTEMLPVTVRKDSQPSTDNLYSRVPTSRFHKQKAFP